MPCLPPNRADLLLCAVAGPADGLCWGVAGRVTVGRGAEVDVADPLLSREHLQVRERGSRVWCRDLGSTNGSYLRWGPVGLRLRGGWCRWPAGARLLAGDTALVVRRRAVAGVRLRSDPGRLLRIAVPAAMVLAMVPFALAGPPWRWALVAAPLAMVAGTLARTEGRGRLSRREDPHHVLVASLEGRAFHAGPVLPARPRALGRADLAGAGWAFVGPGARGAAVWLAGTLAVANDPDILRVSSPWVTTRGKGVEVRFEESPAEGPRIDQCLVTWHPKRAPAWAAVLSAPAWAHAADSWGSALRVSAGGGLPESCLLEEVLPTGAPTVERAWRARRLSLAVPIGVNARGTQVLDLEAGPHALVAGTTGSGKSEFLTTWLLAMALRNPPDLLQYVLVDFKGGAAFQLLQELPHCVSVLTDLDPAATLRALASLKALLRGRERQFAAAGVRDIGEYNHSGAAPLAVIVVVVDEYRALTAQNPQLLDQFLHLAGMGRSLGLHLVAATQRPGGSVGPELRTNMGLRVCLRVPEAVDSIDVLGSPAAAELDRVPGRALVADGTLTPVQVAWAGDRSRVRETVALLARLWRGAPLVTPWADPLPDCLPAGALPRNAIGLADVPEELRREPVPLPQGSVMVLGVGASGKSGVARTVAAAALRAGRHVWLVTAASPADSPGGPGLGAVLHPREVRLVRHLFAHVSEPGSPARTLVLDGVEALVEAWDAVHGAGAAATALGSLARTARAAGNQVVATAEPATGAARWAAGFATRIHLSGTDAATAMMAGLSREDAALVAGPVVPGRGLLGGRLVQFALPGPWDCPPGTPAARRFAPLPAPVAPRAAAGIFLGLGGTAATPVVLPDGSDVIVVGPAGSGRSAAADLITAQQPGAVVRHGTQNLAAVPERQEQTVAVWDHSHWCAAVVGPAARLRGTAAVLVLRPDLMPALPGLDLRAELEPGGPGYAVVMAGERATALRVAQSASGEGLRWEAT